MVLLRQLHQSSQPRTHIIAAVSNNGFVLDYHGLKCSTSEQIAQLLFSHHALVPKRRPRSVMLVAVPHRTWIGGCFNMTVPVVPVRYTEALITVSAPTVNLVVGALKAMR